MKLSSQNLTKAVNDYMNTKLTSLVIRIQHLPKVIVCSVVTGSGRGICKRNHVLSRVQQ